MRNILLAGAGAIALMTAPAFAQMTDSQSTTTSSVDQADPMPDSSVPVSTNSVSDKRGGYEMSPEQSTMYQSWPPERQTDYDTWPMTYQEYYWTLEPVQQEGYWALTEDQRGKIYNMTPEQRTLAWRAVQQQLAGMTPTTPAGQANPPGQGMPTNGVPNPKMANQAVQPAMPATQQYQGGPYKGALTPPPADAMDKDYPICKGDVQDSCINPREAGKNWGNRPLDHWPGKPASEM
ncbi:hypothetical protein [Novosphingobium aquimarinum]|uniref:hypothetical protein n=1 Tax=Novosphingobium aquimarinum TaxID=2682494 RepID=UPI0012EC2E18|nr:hypothetical protein [Novosphingobium aquimarinum]